VGRGLHVACTQSTSPSASQSPCPPPQGEVPPADCAFLVARAIDPSGAPLAGLGVRVDSFILGGYAYASNSATTKTAGSFHLLVYRVNRLQPPASTDTATVGIKAYADPAPSAGRVPLAQAYIQLQFAPLGTLVDTTRGVLTFQLP
jgi:hypothetical protein